MLDRIPEAMQRTDAGVTAVGKHQAPSSAHADHLVIEHIGSHPDQLQLAPSLAQNLVAGRKRDEVREALERHRIAVAYKLGDSFGKGDDLSHYVRNTNRRALDAQIYRVAAPASKRPARTLSALSPDAGRQSPCVTRRSGAGLLADLRERREADPQPA